MTSTYLSYFYYHIDDDKYKVPSSYEREEYVVYIVWEINNVNNCRPEILAIKNIEEILQLPFKLNKEFIVTNKSKLGHNVYNENNYISLNNSDIIRNVLGDYVKLFNSYNKSSNVIEYGPKYSMETPWSSNLKSIYSRMGIKVIRAEKYTRCYYPVKINTHNKINIKLLKNYDPITQQTELFTDSLFKYLFQSSNLSNNNKLDGYQTIPTNTEESIKEFNNQYKLALDNDDIKWIKDLSDKLDRNLTKVELFDLAQSNSEHSRHWVFNSKLILENDSNNDEIELENTLFSLVKLPLKYKKNMEEKRGIPDNSLVAFSDNSSAIKGFNGINPTLTAETHNFPTGIAPFQGATTGVGGRIRDNLAIGTGGDITASLAGYCVEDIGINSVNIENKCLQFLNDNYSKPLHSGRHILTEASNGSSDYGNKVGEAIIGGFVRTFTGEVYGDNEEYKRIYSFRKPIMFTAGIGTVLDGKEFKKELINDNHDTNYLVVCQVGGPAYPIGMGGGSSSSVGQDDGDYQNAVQRGDPEMATRVVNFLRNFKDSDIILSIHDQGAGGCGNVVKEILEPVGGDIDIGNIPLGNKDMSFLEIWCSEYQEQMTFIINNKDWDFVERIGKKENVPVYKVGVVNNTGIAKVSNSNLDSEMSPINLPLKDILSNVPQKTLRIKERNFPISSSFKYESYNKSKSSDLYNKLINILSTPTVGSKKFLTNKVDRSVSGLIVQQQCVGPLQLPLSNYSITAHTHSPTERYGTVSSIGEGSTAGFIPNKKGYSNLAYKVVMEMITNIMGANITGLSDIKCSANWMWSPKNDKYEAYSMYSAMKTLSDLCYQLGIAIDGGKDSVSMYSSLSKNKNDKTNDNTNDNTNDKLTIFSPPTLVLTGYVMTNDFNIRVTPDLKHTDSTLIFIPLIKKWGSLGGSSYSHLINMDGKMNDYSEQLDINKIKSVFNIIQTLIKENCISSLHDISDGGLITTLSEMSFGGDIGIKLTDSNLYNSDLSELSEDRLWFCESPGIVIEVANNMLDYFNIRWKTECVSIPNYIIGCTSKNKEISLLSKSRNLFKVSIKVLKEYWEYPSDYMEQFQTNMDTLNQDMEHQYKHTKEIYSITDKCKKYLNTISENVEAKNVEHNVMILRDVGGNGHREMIAVFQQAGFNTDDITMSELLNMGDDLSLEKYRGIVFVGGFSNGDVPSAAVGWASSILGNSILKKKFNQFKEREDTFSLGVCNGCQLLSYLGWIDTDFSLRRNISGRFESRWNLIKIPDTEINRKSVFLEPIIGCSWGIWSAHGEGRFVFEDEKYGNTSHHNHISAQYIDKKGSGTMSYPENPNGSQYGSAAVSSSDGRHLAIMPHPERCFIEWQMPYNPIKNSKNNLNNLNNGYTPWFVMFSNVYNWCNQ